MFLGTVLSGVPFSSGVFSCIQLYYALHYAHLFFRDNSENNCCKINLNFLGECTSEFLKNFGMLIVNALTS